MIYLDYQHDLLIFIITLFQIRDMAYYLIILFIVVTSFGVVRQAIHFQDTQVSWERALRNIWFYPYWMIYGELFAEEIDRKYESFN